MGFMAPKPPAPPPPPPEPVVPEPVTRVAEEEKRKARQARGRASTIRTTPRGLIGQDTGAASDKMMQ